MRRGDTIAALSSGRPPAAIALVRLSGPDSFAIAAKVAGRLPAPRQATLRTFRDPSGQAIDSGLILRFCGPNSVTGDDIVEFHGHGGRAVVEALLTALVAAGARLAEPGEFTRRALANGRLDLTEAEGLADLLAAETEAQRRAAQARASGAVSRRVEAWRDELLTLSASVEHAIDYAEEEGDEPEAAVASRASRLAADMAAWLAEPRIEPLRDGIRVVLAGPPNAGKSSLLNALCDSSRAIVTPLAGTTRDSIEVPMALDGIPLVLVDTAGLRESGDVVEQHGIARTRDELARADIILWLGADDPQPDPRCLLLHAKSDLGEGPLDRLSVSAKTGAGVTRLRSEIVRRARLFLPAAGGNPLNAREADLIATAREALNQASTTGDVVIIADLLRQARDALEMVVGRIGIDDVLNTLFARFCVGK